MTSVLLLASVIPTSVPNIEVRQPLPEKIDLAEIQAEYKPSKAFLKEKALITHKEVERKPEPAPVSPVGNSVWDKLCECEAGGNWSINTGNGFYGGLQFTLSSWQAVGGSGYPHQASRAEQILRGEKLQALQGWGAWPSCASQLNLL